jgi:hypothetical protein
MSDRWHSGDFGRNPYTTLCPRCENNSYTPLNFSNKWTKNAPPYPAISQADRRTYICLNCANQETFKTHLREELDPISSWPVKDNLAQKENNQ